MFNIKNNSLNNFIPKFVKKKDLDKLMVSGDYQIVQIQNDKKWKEGHIIFSVHISPSKFKDEYKKKLDKNKNIVLYGEYHLMAQYYRILKFENYKVFSTK